MIMPEAFLSALYTNNRLDLLLPEKSLAASAPFSKSIGDVSSCNSELTMKCFKTFLMKMKHDSCL